MLCGGGFMLRDGGVGFCFAAVGGGGGSRSLSRVLPKYQPKRGGDLG